MNEWEKEWLAQTARALKKMSIQKARKPLSMFHAREEKPKPFVSYAEWIKIPGMTVMEDNVLDIINARKRMKLNDLYHIYTVVRT